MKIKLGSGSVSVNGVVYGGGLGNGNFCTLSALFNQFKILTY